MQICLVIGMPVKSSLAISSRRHFFKKAYFKNKFKSSYWRSGRRNIRRTESKKTAKARYKERKIDVFSPKMDVVERSTPCKKRTSRAARIYLDNYSNLAI